MNIIGRLRLNVVSKIVGAGQETVKHIIDFAGLFWAIGQSSNLSEHLLE